MSNSIWHTVEETPESCEDIAFYVDGYLYSGYYEPQYNQYGIFGASKVEKWCYKRELSSYILALETDLIAQVDKAERLQKAVDLIANMEQRLCIDDPVDILDDVLKIAKDEIKQLIKGGGNRWARK